MSMKTVRRIAARLFGAGENRIKIVDEEKAQKAITSDDVRDLYRDGALVVEPKKANSRGKARFKQSRKVAGRRRGPGSSRGAYYAKHARKTRWIEQVRSQRAFLSSVKGQLKQGAYAQLYRKVKGNAFRSKKILKQHMDENKLWTS